MLKEHIRGMAVGTAFGALATALGYEARDHLFDGAARAEAVAATMADGGSGSRGPSSGPARSAAASDGGGPGRGTPAPSDAGRAQSEDAALRREIESLGRELGALEAEKGALAGRLARAEAKLAQRAAGAGPGERRDRDEFDLDQEDWKELARKGSVKFRVPCQRPRDWAPSAEELDRLGLAPDDAEVLRTAYARSHERVWAKLRSLCIEAIGNEAVVDLLGRNTCTHVVVNLSKAADAESWSAAMREVAETRAGERPPPAEGVQKHPLFELFWTLTGETPAFEAELAESFGPEDAKRIAYSDTTCSQTSSYSGGNDRRAPADRAKNLE